MRETGPRLRRKRCGDGVRYTYVLIYPDGRLLDWNRGSYFATSYVDGATTYTEAGAREVAIRLADHGLRVLDLSDFPEVPSDIYETDNQESEASYGEQ